MTKCSNFKKIANHVDLLMNALEMRTFIPWDAWQAPSHAGYLQAWTVRKQSLTGICSHMAGTSLRTCPSGPWKIIYQIQFASVLVRQSSFIDMSIPHWIGRGTLSPIIDRPTMASPLHPVINMCHLAMCHQAKQFCWCVHSSSDTRRHILRGVSVLKI